MTLCPDSFRSLAKPSQINYLADLCAAIEAGWSQTTERHRMLAFLGSLLATLVEDAEQDLAHLGRLHPLAEDTTINLKQFLAIATPIKRLAAQLSPTSQHQIQIGDRPEPEGAPFPLYVILDNIRSAHNVGTILRTGEALGVTEVIMSGYTATPDNPKVTKTAMGAEAMIRWRWFSAIGEAISYCASLGCSTFALETSTDAESVFDFHASFPLAIILGNEHFGLSPETLSACTGVIKIPTFGRKNSLNVATAFATFGYEMRRQYMALPS